MAGTLELKAQSVGRFFMWKHNDGSNQIFLYMNQSQAWFKFIIIFIDDNDDFTLG